MLNLRCAYWSRWHLNLQLYIFWVVIFCPETARALEFNDEQLIPTINRRLVKTFNFCFLMSLCWKTRSNEFYDGDTASVASFSVWEPKPALDRRCDYYFANYRRFLADCQTNEKLNNFPPDLINFRCGKCFANKYYLEDASRIRQESAVRAAARICFVLSNFLKFLKFFKSGRAFCR